MFTCKMCSTSSLWFYIWAICGVFFCLIIQHVSPYANNFQLYDGHFVLVEERTQIHYSMYLGETTNLPPFLTHSDRLKQDSNQRCLLVRDLVVWDWCLNHSATVCGLVWTVFYVRDVVFCVDCSFMCGLSFYVWAVVLCVDCGFMCGL
jgi:hypothetical protein